MPSGGACPRSQHDSPPCLCLAGCLVCLWRHWCHSAPASPTPNGNQRNPEEPSPPCAQRFESIYIRSGPASYCQNTMLCSRSTDTSSSLLPCSVQHQHTARRASARARHSSPHWLLHHPPASLTTELMPLARCGVAESARACVACVGVETCTLRGRTGQRAQRGVGRGTGDV